jgi:prevent-host-death family protein
MSATYPLPEPPSLDDLISRAAAHERLVVTRHGKPVMAVVPLHDLEDLEAMDRADIALCESILARGDEPIPHDQVVAMLGLDDDQTV